MATDGTSTSTSPSRGARPRSSRASSRGVGTSLLAPTAQPAPAVLARGGSGGRARDKQVKKVKRSPSVLAGSTSDASHDPNQPPPLQQHHRHPQILSRSSSTVVGHARTNSLTGGSLSGGEATTTTATNVRASSSATPVPARSTAFAADRSLRNDAVRTNDDDEQRKKNSAPSTMASCLCRRKVLILGLGICLLYSLWGEHLSLERLEDYRSSMGIGRGGDGPLGSVTRRVRRAANVSTSAGASVSDSDGIGGAEGSSVPNANQGTENLMAAAAAGTSSGGYGWSTLDKIAEWTSTSLSSKADKRLSDLGKSKQQFQTEYDARAAERRKRIGRGLLLAGNAKGMTVEGDGRRERQVQQRRKVEKTLETARYPHNHALRAESRSGVGGAVREPRRKKRNKSTTKSNSKLKPADIDQLCGQHAQAAAKKRPDNYLVRDALTSKSRVLITGILGQVGYNLALALVEQCGVTTIIGMDHMYPNTVEHRLVLSHRMARLYQKIPNLTRPIILTATGLDQPASSARDKWKIVSATGELDWVAKYKPTHIVHLASGADVNAFRDVVNAQKGRLNVESPYVESVDYEEGSVNGGRVPALFQIRQSMASMELLLASMAQQQDDDDRSPHFAYASVAHSPPVAKKDPRYQNQNGCHEGELFHQALGSVDELLATKYYSTGGVYSVALRLPTVYGPMGKVGGLEFDAGNAAVRQWQGHPISSDGRNQTVDDSDKCRKIPKHYLHVDDAVESLIAAMQYRRKDGDPTAFDVAGDVGSLGDFTATVKDRIAFVTNKNKTKTQPRPLPTPAKRSRTFEYLGWEPKVSFSDGITKLVAWHLDDIAPYGHPSGSTRMTGRKYLAKAALPKNNTTEWSAQRGSPLLPCSSECSRDTYCSPSIFDKIIRLTRTVTDGCDMVFYTESWDTTTKDVPFETAYPRNTTAFKELCNVLFIPRDSALVKSVVMNVSDSILRAMKLNVKKSSRNERIDKLNGRLLYKGWILLMMPSAPEKDDPAIKSLLKLAPRRLFATSVTKAVYCSGNYSKPVEFFDGILLSKTLRRDGTEKKLALKTGEDGEKYTIEFPVDPTRKAVLAAPVMRHPDLLVNASVNSSPNIKMKTAMRVMMLENNVDPSLPESEPTHLRRQYDLYLFVTASINRKEFRSNFEPSYLYRSNHWISSKTLVHDFASEEGRQLRCDWYREHTLWGNEYDQLSFARVMSERTLHRQLYRHEADSVDELIMRGKMTEHERVAEKIIDEMVDWREWHSLVSEGEKDGIVDSPPSRQDVVYDILRVKKLLPERNITDTDYFVRIFQPQTSKEIAKYYDTKLGKRLPAPRTNNFYRGKRKIFGVK